MPAALCIGTPFRGSHCLYASLRSPWKDGISSINCSHNCLKTHLCDAGPTQTPRTRCARRCGRYSKTARAAWSPRTLCPSWSSWGRAGSWQMARRTLGRCNHSRARLVCMPPPCSFSHTQLQAVTVAWLRRPGCHLAKLCCRPCCTMGVWRASMLAGTRAVAPRRQLRHTVPSADSR